MLIGENSRGARFPLGARSPAAFAFHDGDCVLLGDRCTERRSDGST
jgi:hypothetical protein